jgi:predicted secreted Zn-dependent protease
MSRYSMLPSAPQDLDWRISRTCESGACVMVARRGDSVLLGNTSQPDGPISAYTRAEWKEFLAGAKRGDFDDIA